MDGQPKNIVPQAPLRDRGITKDGKMVWKRFRICVILKKENECEQLVEQMA